MTSASLAMPGARLSGRWLARRIARQLLNVLINIVTAAALAGVLVVGGVVYGVMLLRLPLAGDATIHAQIARSLFRAGPLATTTQYPLFYHAAAGIALVAGGETGFKLLTLCALLLTVAGVFLLAQELTDSRLCAVAAALLAMFAPESLFYTGRMYMEVLLSGLVVFAVYFLARYVRSLRRRELLCCAVLSGLAAATKQQGLVILMPSIALFLGGWLVWRQRRTTERLRGLSSVGLFVLVAMLLAVPAYIPMLHSTGRILPATDYTDWLNASISTVSDQHGSQDAWATRWDNVLDASFAENGGDRGFARAESRHVWPWQAWTTTRGLFGVHTLFWSSPPWRFPDWVTLPICTLFLAGAALWAWQWWRKPFFWFLVLFMACNYAAFMRNNDQQRYHVYVAYLLTFLIPFGVMGWSRIHRRLSIAPMLATLALLGVFAGAAISYVPERVAHVERMPQEQAYAPSVGGNASVREVGAWLKLHSSSDDRFYAVPANEFSYYADREGIFDYRLYFLPPQALSEVIRDMGVRYVVIADSAVQPDAGWNNVVKMPASFAARVSRLYPAVYASTARDVVVYDASQHITPGPDAGWDVGWTFDSAPTIISAGERSPIHVTLTNDGTLIWPRVNIRISYHWNFGGCPGDQSDPRSVWDGARTSLPRNVAPHDNIPGLAMNLVAPPQPGLYCLVPDLVSEHLGWVSRMGTSNGIQTVLVQ